jgi:serralysin
MNGTDQNDTMTGTKKHDVLNGLGGNDTLLGHGGDDVLNGGRGNDTLTGGTGNDTFKIDAQGFGFDEITDFKSGHDKIDVSALHVGSFDELVPYIHSANGNSEIVLEWGQSFTPGGFSANQSILVDGDDTLKAKDFTFDTSTKALTVEGTNQSDVLFGAGGNDIIHSNGGNDRLNGGGGNDTITGGTGNEVVFGNSGKDVFNVGAGGFGDDVVADFSAADGDRIDLSAQHISSFAQLHAVPQFLVDSNGNVAIELEHNVTFTPSAYNPNESVTILGLSSADLKANMFVFDTTKKALTIGGTDGADTLFGALGNDTINGGGRADILLGGAGDDTLIGGTGNDYLFGEAGKDRFAFDNSNVGHGETDTIADFHHGQHDKIDLLAIDANANKDGDQAFKIVDAFTGHAGQMVVGPDGIDQFSVRMDVDGDSEADFTIVVHASQALVDGDFVL